MSIDSVDKLAGGLDIEAVHDAGSQNVTHPVVHRPERVCLSAARVPHPRVEAEREVAPNFVPLLHLQEVLPVLTETPTIRIPFRIFEKRRRRRTRGGHG